MNNYVFYVQWILDRKYGKNVRVLDSNYCSGEIVKMAPRHQGLPWLTPLLTTFILCAGVAFISPRVQAAYTVVELAANLSEEAGASVRGLNDMGEVVGGGPRGGRHMGFLLRSDGTRHNFEGRHGSDFTVARHINGGGQVVGSTNSLSSVVAFRALRGGAQLPLNPLPGDNSSAAFAINDAGQTVGSSSGPGGGRAIIWSRTGLPQELPGFPDSQSSRAYAIDPQGNAVGVSEIQQAPHAVFWKVGQPPKDLGALPGQFISEARAINGNGVTVGFSEDEAQQRHAVRWTSYGAGPIEDLGTLQDGHTSWALGVNDSGQVVGTSQTKNGVLHAFLWTQESGMLDLNDPAVTTLAPGTVLTDALAINSSGQILAIGQKQEATAEADVELSIFLLTE